MISMMGLCIRRHLRNEGVDETKIYNILYELPHDLLLTMQEAGMDPPWIMTDSVGALQDWEPEDE
jgi:hypothetical protein